MGIPIIGDIIQGVAKMGGDWLQGRQKIKAAKIDAQVARYTAEAQYADKLLDHQGSYDIQALKQMQHSWKDEFLTLLVMVPVICSFVPKLRPYVLKGFEALEKTPWWYVGLVVGVYAATFGLRWLFGKKVEKIIKEKK